MKLKHIFLCLLLSLSVAVSAQRVTITANGRSAESVFKELMRQTGKNFIYQSGTLSGLRVNVNAKNRPLGEVLDDIFSGTDITYKISGNNVTLKRGPKPSSPAKAPAPRRFTVSGFIYDAANREAVVGASVFDLESGASAVTNASGFFSMTVPEGPASLRVTYFGTEPWESGRLDVSRNMSLKVELSPVRQLHEVVVNGSVNNAKAMNSTEIGSINLSNEKIRETPVIFGESDVIKTLQLEPGVTSGIEGMANMYVHGGDTDENMYMLDNIPLYQVNHLGGLFSAFNTGAIRNADFYKSSFPAKYDGRLSSYLDAHTKDGNPERHQGSVTLGLTSGAVNIDGPIWKDHTTYSVAVRRSWFDVITYPASLIMSSVNKDRDVRFRYDFTDVNAKITHRFSDRSRAFVSVYYGQDYLKYVNKEIYRSTDESDKTTARMWWGNIVASAGWNYTFSPSLFGELTAAFSRYFSSLNRSERTETTDSDGATDFTEDKLGHRNKIDDIIVRADFDWHPVNALAVNFGTGYTYHSFLPSKGERTLITPGDKTTVIANDQTLHAHEASLYAGADYTPADFIRINAGAHAALFSIGGRTHANLSPRLSFRITPVRDWAIKAGYSRTTQFVHQISESAISLPTDQWIPITGGNKPQTADKIAAGIYYTTPGKQYTVSVEGYWKWMDNLLDYSDEYYLVAPDAPWDQKMTSGKGRSRGIDFKVTREYGRFTGSVSYSLLWADRRYDGKNGGQWFPARFDNRHKINVFLNFKFNEKWSLGATWTGMTGNRISIPLQCWDDPQLGPWHFDMDYYDGINNYRLPFYHRLDISATRHTKHGFWTFSVYNAYCNMNVIAVRRDYSDSYETVTWPDGSVSYTSRPVFQYVRLLPFIPSVSYTWEF